MNALMFAYAALLFVVLTPGVLLRLPPKGSKLAVAVTHGVAFAVVWHFTHKMVWRAAYEGFQGATKERSVAATKTSARVSTNSPDLQNAHARVNDANRRLEVVEDKYNNAAKMAVNIENELIDARKQLQNAQNALRSVQGLPPDEPKKFKESGRRL